VKKSNNEEDKTEAVRTTLFFLQFLENKIVNKPIFRLNTLDHGEIKGFQRFIVEYLKHG